MYQKHILTFVQMHKACLKLILGFVHLHKNLRIENVNNNYLNTPFFFNTLTSVVIT
jgi:hypothetical protein